MSLDHFGHDHGGDDPPWFQRLMLILVIGLIMVIAVALLLSRSHISATP